MTITLTPEQEQIVDDQLRSGIYRTPEEVVADAFRALRTGNPKASRAGGHQREAVCDMLKFVEDNRTTLTGISVKELIHEGHHR
ncbi:MAG: type II toxin-antitoxin system ParD family antitoxin [Bryobacteraceae bacterium]